jgi:hypothetical protein
MKKILIYTILAACILALSACSHKQLDPPAPEIEVDETAPISFTTGVAGTKSLIGNNTADGEVALEKSSTTMQVFDYLTATDGTVVTYIDDQITGVADGAWTYANGGPYYWTKTGTHTFFGYLTVSPEGYTKWQWTQKTIDANGTLTQTPKEVAPILNKASKTVTISDLEMTPMTTQFDFLYSDVKSYVMPARPTTQNKAVDLNMKHLFTALGVKIVNKTGEDISNVSVTLTNVHPTQSATISWDGVTNGNHPVPTYVPALSAQKLGNASDMSLGSAGTKAEPIRNNATSPLFSGTDGAYRLLWPQAILTPPSPSGDAEVIDEEESTDEEDDPEEVEGQFIIVTYDQSARTFKKALNEAFTDITAMEAGKKYLLTITITSAEVIFNVQVKDLENMNAKEESSESFTFTS